ncbi:hypothetical protein CW362_15890 [Streptomyces populi]|uniref:Uncharacterized protein n=1 Tax=Streptomyces populi TaxID=2058924 RepID=A0A2I0SQ83_9ACTN|nr:hypothetical protein CW362_15890 [Streptomyces populi]
MPTHTVTRSATRLSSPTAPALDPWTATSAAALAATTPAVSLILLRLFIKPSPSAVPYRRYADARTGGYVQRPRLPEAA